MKNQKWLSIAAASTEEGLQASQVLIKEPGRVASSTNSTTIAYTMNGLWMGKEKIGRTEYTAFELPGGGSTEVVGQPELPAEGIFVAVPKGATSVAVKVLSSQKEVLKEKILVKPVAQPVTELQLLEGKVETKINAASYTSAKAYPGKEVEFVGLKEVDDVTVAHIMIYPVQYKASEGQVTLIKQMQLEVSYALPKTLPKMSTQQFVPINGNYIPGYEKMKTLNRMEIPAELREEIPEVKPLTRGGTKLTAIGAKVSVQVATELAPMAGGVLSVFQSLKFTSRNSELIIITTNSLKEAMEPYRAARAYAPFNAIIVTTEKIQAEFPATTIKKSIKDFITFAYNNYSTRPRYFVLGGDVDLIPMDIVTRGGNEYATDHYYADMGGNLTPELIISRVPASDFTVMQNTCKFFADYYNHRGPDWNGDWLAKVMLVAYQNTQPTYTECSDQIANNIKNRFSVSKYYGNNTSKADVVNAINSGAHIVHYRGHGGQTNWSSSNGINTTDIGALNFGSRIPMVFNICCQNGHVDNAASSVSVAESWIRNRKAIAAFASSRDSWTYPNNDFAKYIFEAIMEGNNSAGRIILRAKTKMVLNHSSSNGHMDNLVMYNLFGDPTANVVSSADYLRGLWDMEHDGWKGVLNIKSLYSFSLLKYGNDYYPVWYFSGEYTTQGGDVVTVYGKVGGKDINNTNGNQRSNHKIEFWVKFSNTNNQRFSAYVYTRNKKAMAGTTWYAGTPYGFHAIKR